MLGHFGQKKESPSGNHDKEGQAAVAAFRPWRGSLAFSPWPLTERGQWQAPRMMQNEKSGRFSGNPLPIKKTTA